MITLVSYLPVSPERIKPVIPVPGRSNGFFEGWGPKP